MQQGRAARSTGQSNSRIAEAWVQGSRNNTAIRSCTRDLAGSLKQRMTCSCGSTAKASSGHTRRRVSAYPIARTIDDLRRLHRLHRLVAPAADRRRSLVLKNRLVFLTHTSHAARPQSHSHKMYRPLGDFCVVCARACRAKLVKLKPRERLREAQWKTKTRS